MKVLPSVSLEGKRLLPNGWDLAAAGLVMGFIVLFAEASRNLGHSLNTASTSQLRLSAE